MKRKGFTLVELLVVIAIIALLMGILMPALARVRQIAYRMVCGTNLSGIGKAMILYSNDNEEEYPLAGIIQPKWSTTGAVGGVPFLEKRVDAFKDNTDTATIGSSFFLLVKYADVTVKQFVCKGDVGTKPFKLTDYPNGAKDVQNITDIWDFGRKPSIYCSYSMHMPYYKQDGTPGFPISTNGDPASPLAADRSPYFDTNADWLDDNGNVIEQNSDSPCDEWEASARGGYNDRYKTGNSACHQREGQNVLFNDMSVAFAKYPNVGIDKDNIYQHWKVQPPLKPDPREREACGYVPARGTQSAGSGDVGSSDAYPRAFDDAFLVNEPQCLGFVEGTR